MDAPLSHEAADEGQSGAGSPAGLFLAIAGDTVTDSVTQKILDWLRDEGTLPQHVVRARLKDRGIPHALGSAAIRRLRNMDLVRSVRKPVPLFYATPRLDSDPTEPLSDPPLPDTPSRRKSGPPVPPPPPWINPIRRRALGLPSVDSKTSAAGTEQDYGDPRRRG